MFEHYPLYARGLCSPEFARIRTSYVLNAHLKSRPVRNYRTLRANCWDNLVWGAGTYFATLAAIGGVTMRHQRKMPLRVNYGRLERLDISEPPTHIDSDLCWCDPVVEFNEDGDPRVIHKEVTWN
jgi:hypothetical protein